MMEQVGYAGYLGIEYVWTEWEHCNEVDNLSETAWFKLGEWTIHPRFKATQSDKF